MVLAEIWLTNLLRHFTAPPNPPAVSYRLKKKKFQRWLGQTNFNFIFVFFCSPMAISHTHTHVFHPLSPALTPPFPKKKQWTVHNAIIVVNTCPWNVNKTRNTHRNCVTKNCYTSTSESWKCPWIIIINTFNEIRVDIYNLISFPFSCFAFLKVFVGKQSRTVYCDNYTKDR